MLVSFNAHNNNVVLTKNKTKQTKILSDSMLNNEASELISHVAVLLRPNRQSCRPGQYLFTAMYKHFKPAQESLIRPAVFLKGYILCFP